MAHARCISLPTQEATVGATFSHEGVAFKVERIICKATDQENRVIVAARRVDGLSPSVRINDPGAWNHGLYKPRR